MSKKIPRAKPIKIERASSQSNIRQESEVQAAYAQIGSSPNRNTKSWYRDIYDFYQNNEC